MGSFLPGQFLDLTHFTASDVASQMRWKQRFGAQQGDFGGSLQLLPDKITARSHTLYLEFFIVSPVLI